MTALSTQVGGDHYRKLKIQPVQYIHANGLGFIEGSIVKYITRWRNKGGVKDLEKIKHFVDLLIELESKPDMERLCTKLKEQHRGWPEIGDSDIAPTRSLA